ncbi:hypothetical protein NL529_32615, partial [Klebsiella pneumoniae]|nr:hypothetical protein [Klebsiella pneumoniae]
MKMVNVHLLYITQVKDDYSLFAVTCERGKNLYQSAKERLGNQHTGMSINGGYFIVQGNIEDKLNNLPTQSAG